MFVSIQRTIMIALAAGALLLTSSLRPALADNADVPAPGQSKKVDEIKARGTLKVAAIGEFPWLPENTTGSGPQFSGPAWMLAEAYASRLGVKLEVIPVSHETKVPILASGQADISIAPLAVTTAREQVVDFIIYSKYSVCLFGRADNAKLQGIENVDGLNRSDLTMAYFTGTPPETWAPTRLPLVQLRGVQGSGANAPVDEILSGRADIAPIDNVAWPKLAASVSGLISFPPGDKCLSSDEMAAPVGMAIDKNEPLFLAWLRAVAAEMKDATDAEELRIMKSVTG
jgi:polar amino acid transport system substrate-binding protein